MAWSRQRCRRPGLGRQARRFSGRTRGIGLRNYAIATALPAIRGVPLDVLARVPAPSQEWAFAAPNERFGRERGQSGGVPR